MNHKEYLKRRDEGMAITLPSGLEVKVKPVDGTLLLKSNYPSELMAVIRKHIAGVDKNDEAVANALMESGDMTEAITSSRTFGEILAQNAIVYPKIVLGEAQGDDEFSASDIESGDLNFLWGVFNLPLAQLAGFCREQNARMELVLALPNDAASAVSSTWVEGNDAQLDAGNGDAALHLAKKAHQRQ